MRDIFGVLAKKGDLVVYVVATPEPDSVISLRSGVVASCGEELSTNGRMLPLARLGDFCVVSKSAFDYYGPGPDHEHRRGS